MQIAETPDIEETTKQIAEFLEDATEQKDRGGFYLFGKLRSSNLSRLLANPLVIGVHAVESGIPSDERQATALTTNLTMSGTNLIPTTPGGYTTWLTNACSFCGNLEAEGFVLGLADTGVDTGSPAGPSRHLDLGPVGRVRYGTVFLPQRDLQGNCPQGERCETIGVCRTCDGNYHGTFVAGIMGGNAGTGTRDRSAPVSGFFRGTGIVPSAGILSTKIANSEGRQSLTVNGNQNNIFNWAADATARGVYVQNHSWNQYLPLDDNRGRYTLTSHDFDIAVRDSDGAGTQLTPITLTVSAGNRHRDTDSPNLAMMPPATAKNVIAMGGAESVRNTSEWRQCEGNPFPVQNHADSFANIMADSKHGTNVQSGGECWNTYNKPDLFAPASQIVGARSIVIRNQFPHIGFNCFGYGGDPPNDDPDHMIGSGTSFAAPVGAAGALLAGRAYSQWLGGVPNPASASPALRKAMLVATARSMRGGIDKTVTPNQPIAARPNAVQGFRAP